MDSIPSPRAVDQSDFSLYRKLDSQVYPEIDPTPLRVPAPECPGDTAVVGYLTALVATAGREWR